MTRARTTPSLDDLAEPGAVFSFEDETYAVVAITSSARAPAGGLTKAEADIARSLLQGLSKSEIARLRGTSHRTVEHQIGAVFSKLRVASLVELVRELRRLRW